ncbi:NAD(P)/FAD-dependent oxidoreductase [Thermovibrio sp.]
MAKKVVVIGGGIGGVEAAFALCQKCFDVELISERDYLYIYPISIWIPTHEYEWKDVILPLDQVAKANGFKLTIGKVERISTKERKVYLSGGEVKEYDYLVIALGGSKVEHKGKENFLSICGKPEESLKLRERIDQLIEKGGGIIAAGFGGNPKDPSGVRGGPAFEFIFNLHCYFKKKGIRDKFELHFFAPMPKPGIRLGEKNAERAYKMLDSLGVKRHFGKKIKEFQPDGVVFEDDTKLKTDLTMFIPATNGHPVLKNSDLPLNEAGFVKIEPTCAVPGTEETVWAIGDSAALEGPKWKAKQGHLAEVMGRIVARNIESKEKGEDKREEYIHHLHILCLMDMGPCFMSGALVFRNDKRAIMLPLPLIGHSLKKLWGWYYKASKLKKVPRIPGFDAP